MDHTLLAVIFWMFHEHLCKHQATTGATFLLRRFLKHPAQDRKAVFTQAKVCVCSLEQEKSSRTSDLVCSAGHVHMVERPQTLLSWELLINHSIVTSVWLQPRRDVWGMQCLSISPGAPVRSRRGGGGGVGGDGWRQVDSCVDRLETLNAVWCSAGTIYALTAAGSGSRIYLAA